MDNRDEIIRKLYKTYKFIEEDISKFNEIPCLSDVKDFSDGARKLNAYVVQEINKDGFVTTFKKIAQPSGIDIANAFIILYFVSEKTGYEIKEEDVIAMASIEEYKEFYDGFIKHYFIEDVDDLNERGLINTLQKRVLSVRLNSPEIKKYWEEQKQEQRKLNRKSIYQDMPFSREEIDEVLSTLSPEERDLIERKEKGEKLSPEEIGIKVPRIKLRIIEKLKTLSKKEEKPTISNEVPEEKITQQESPTINNKIIRVLNANTMEKIKQKVSEMLSIDNEEAWLIINRLPDNAIILLNREVNGEKLSIIESDEVSNAIQKVMNKRVIEVMQSAKKWENILKKDIEERRVDENMSNENKYNIVAYKRIDADHSLIDKFIAELPEKEQKLIERKGRIVLGVFDKLLTPEEEKKLENILNKLISKIEGKEESQEEHVEPQEEKIEESSIPKKRGRRPQSIYVLVPVPKEVLDQYITQELDNEDLNIVYTREKLIQENRFDEIPKSYKSIIQRIVLKARKELMTHIEKNISKAEPKEGNSFEVESTEASSQSKKIGRKKNTIYESVPNLSKETIDVLIEKLDDKDKKIIQARNGEKKLTSKEDRRYDYIASLFKKGKVPGEKKPRVKSKKPRAPKKETVKPRTSIYELVPVDKEVLDNYINNRLTGKIRELIYRREKIVSKNSSEEITEKEADSFNAAVIRARKNLIPEEKMEEAYQKIRNAQRKSVYEYVTVPASKEEIDAIIETLSDEEKKLVKKRVQGDHTSQSESYKIKNIGKKIDVRLKEKRKKEGETPISREQLCEELKQSESKTKSDSIEPATSQTIEPEPPVEIDEDERILANYSKGLLAAATKSAKVAERVGAINLAMISLRYGTVEGVPKRTSEEIAKFLEMDSETVEKTIANTLKEIYDVIVESLGNNNTNSEKTFVKTGSETKGE